MLSVNDTLDCLTIEINKQMKKKKKELMERGNGPRKRLPS